MRIVKGPIRDYRGIIFKRREEILNKPNTIFNHLKNLNQFYELQQLKQLEDFAHRNGLLVVPSIIFNWRRRKNFENNKYICNGKHYYLVYEGDLKVQELYNFHRWLEERVENNVILN